jgi:uncharacterized protein (TIGR02246 family)
MRAATTLAGLALLGAGLALGAQGQARRPEADPPPRRADADRPADARAIRALVADFLRAFDAGDAPAIAALFTPDGRVTDEAGDDAVGRDAIAARFAASFDDNPGGKIAIKDDSLRFLGADAAVEEGTAVITPGDGAGPPESVRYTALYVKRDGRWLHDSVRDHRAAEAETTPHDRLKELGWMVGEWVDESADAVVFTTCKWSDDKNYLLRDFTLKVEGRPATAGTQRIGWDPLTKGIKSWVFDADGGHSEGLWSRDGDRWVVKSAGVLADGRTASATNVITFVNKDTTRWASVDRTVGGEAIPDVEEITIVRRPPKPM